MDYEELIGLLHKELSIIFFSFIGINSLYYLIYKKCVKGILDPLLIAIIFSSLANTVPIFLYAVGAMESELFIFIILAEGGFWYTFYKTYISFPFKKQIKTNDNGSIFKILGYLSLFIVIILQLISYKLNGIPIFNESRFTNTGGVDTIVNLLMRITEPFKLYIYLLKFRK